MSQRTHQRQLERARAKREAEAAAVSSQRNRTVLSIVVALIAVAVVVFAFVARGGDDDPTIASGDGDSSQSEEFSTDGDTQTDTGDSGDAGDTQPDPAAGLVTAAGDPPCENPSAGAPEVTATPYAAAPEMAIDAEATYTAVMTTTCGVIELELFAADAPLTVNNFVTLARDGYYDGVPFHRVIDGFMIQGGDPTGTGHGNGGEFPGYTFDDELDTVATYGYGRGMLAMANAGPSTNGSQFFIVQGDASHLSTHTVFGRVTAGMEIVDRIALGPQSGGIAIEPVRIISIEITEA